MTFLRSLLSGPTRTLLPHRVTCRDLPSTVLTSWEGFKYLDNTSSGRTWYFKMSTSLALFSGFIKFANVPAGRALKASFVGAKTVNFPAELKVSAKPAATTAETKVLKSAVCSASCTMFCCAAPGIISIQPAAAKGRWESEASCKWHSPWGENTAVRHLLSLAQRLQQLLCETLTFL